MRCIMFLILLLITPLLQAQNLTIGILPFLPPLVIATDEKNHYVGFDADLMKEICQRIHATCQFQASNFDDILIGVMNGTFDLGIGEFTITPEREQQFLFSIPYLQSYAQYLTRKNSNIRTIADMRGKTLGIQHPVIFAPMVTSQFGNNINIKTYHYIPDMMNALTNNEVDVVILDAANAESIMANTDNLLLVGDKTALGLGYGIVASKQKNDLMVKINQAILAMETDGTYLTIYNTYFGNMSY